VNVLKLLVQEKFYKTVPKEKKKEVNERITYLMGALEKNNFTFEGLPEGLNFIKVESVSPTIYKFNVDKGNRILCSKGEILYPANPEYGKSLVLLAYTNHDSQIRMAENKDFSKQEPIQRIVNKEGLQSTNSDKEETILDLYNQITTIKNITVDPEKLIDLFGEEGNFYRLDSNQEALVRITEKGQFVFGSAGSGKTTISVYKIIQFLQLTKDTNAKIGYFTFSNRLREQTERMFEKIATELMGYDWSDIKGKVEFHTVKEYLEQTSSMNGRIITYEKFKEWFDAVKAGSSSFDSAGLWKERRGILQGMIGSNWQYTVELPVKDFNKAILNKLNETDNIQFHAKETCFTLNKELNAICNEVEKAFGNSVDFRNKIINAYNRQIAAKKQLTEDDYFNLKDRDSLFLGEDRKKVMNLFKQFQDYQNQELRRNRFFEEGEIVRSALLNSSAIFEYLIIDEVQDLTEIQVYYLCQLLKSKNNAFICGDFHQTINPTFFNVGRIKSIFGFLGGTDQFEEGTLQNNYRSSESIVEFANKMAELRQKSVTTKQEYDYAETAMRGPTRKPYLFMGDKDALWEYVKDKSYLFIVVSSDQTKKQMINQYPELKLRVLTVSEVKGIEKKYIVTYNILTEYKQQWEEIFTQLDSESKLKSELYRYYFNVVYVAITRARDVLGMVEEDLPEKAKEWLLDQVDVIPKFDIRALGLQEVSTIDDFFKEAIEHEENENYELAIPAYENIILKGDPSLMEAAEKGRKRCLIKNEFQLNGDYALCGEQLLELKEYEESIKYLQKGKNAPALLKAILLSNSIERYDINKEMERLKTNPLTELVLMNDERLTTRYLIREVEPFQHQMNELVRKSNKIVDGRPVLQEK
jgi:DNA helicase II / ATP-dependent DNA helicase PcrA